MVTAQCGTPAGYRRHHADMEHACHPCRDAARRAASRDRYRRAAGRTPEAAFYADCHATAQDRMKTRLSESSGSLRAGGAA